MRASSASRTGQIAIALASVAIIGLIFIILFSVFIRRSNDPFDTLNGVGIAVSGLLSGELAWKLYPTYYSHSPRESRVALGFAIVGACFALIGSTLLIFKITGWLPALFVTTFGYAMTGLWLMGLNYSALNWPAFPTTLAQYGLITGWVMMMGILTVPGILTGVDAVQAAPWFVLIALFAGGFGWSVLFTIWCIGLGYLLLINR